jgi:hypothetical protein
MLLLFSACSTSGAMAQLVARLNGIEKVTGSSPVSSINLLPVSATLPCLCVPKGDRYQYAQSAHN